MPSKKNSCAEREASVCRRLAQGQQYGQIVKELKWNNNTGFAVFNKLIKAGKIRRVRTGHYALAEGSAMPGLANPTPARGNGADPETFVPVSPPIRAPENIIENLATELMGKIGALQPLLLLHKDLFAAIEKNTLELVEAIIEVKPRILTQPEREEYRELKHIKQRAEKIAAGKKYPPTH